MKFNKLYLHGFKSFVEKTTVDFPDGITAIVGPNGSGKSNIMDAVRWVFGEQNAKELRGAEMEDIVFNGSQKRKPAGFAEVGLTLSDIDEAVAAKYGTFSEITITRKFYKTGEREYYINNRKCRLKDIKDIFMDTGLGARSISIIEQGKVDKIINATPEELRFFLEETAGVTKFKDKKKDAERRLGQTRDNLDRVNDIISEIIGRREALAAQVKVLRESEALQERRRSLEKKFLCSSYAQRIAERSELTGRLAESKMELEGRIAEYSQYVRRENEAALLYSQKQAESASLQEKRLDAAKNVTRAEGRIASLKDRLSSSEAVKVQLAGDIEKAEAQLAEAKLAAGGMAGALEDAEAALSAADDKIDSLGDVIDDIKGRREDAEEEFASADAEYLEYTSAVTDKRNRLIRREAELEHQRSSLDRLKAERSSVGEAASGIQEKKESLALLLDGLSTDFMRSESELAEAKEGASLAKSACEELKIKSSGLEASLNGVKKSVDFLEEELAASSGASGSDGELLKELGPRLLIDCLGGFPRTKLTEVGDVLLFADSDMDKVLAAVSSMKSSLKFTFESMTPLITERLETDAPEEIGPGIYFSSGIYRKAGEEDRGFKIIRIKERLDGERSRAEALEREITLCAASRDAAEKELEEKSRVLSAAEKELAEKREALASAKAELGRLEADAERSRKRASTIDKEIELAEKTLEETERETASLKEEMRLASEKREEAEERRSELEDRLEFINGELEDKKDEMRELKIERSARESEAESVRREIAASSRRSEELSAGIASLKKRLDELINRDEAAWKSELASLEDELTESGKALLSLEEALKDSLREQDEIKSRIEEIKLQTEKRNNIIKTVEEEIKQREVSLASVGSFLEAISGQYSEKFGSDINFDYERHAEDNFQPKKVKEEINRIEAQLEELGPINLNALNDYNEAEERYAFLSGQRTDLEGSVADITSFINETDEATVRMFEATFGSVKEKFVEVFHILFGNGEAELRLTEPDNLLSSGVEIYIQPPGKKLQHMGLLSGGEKALTAMTLLFALFLQKPTPFCFLDEVDAPLDDANVERYTGMVKALSDKTQFILITHNHNTMAIADSLYGVTMQEYGVSSILSVKLEQVAQAGR